MEIFNTKQFNEKMSAQPASKDMLSDFSKTPKKLLKSGDMILMDTAESICNVFHYISFDDFKRIGCEKWNGFKHINHDPQGGLDDGIFMHYDKTKDAFNYIKAGMFDDTLAYPSDIRVAINAILRYKVSPIRLTKAYFMKDTVGEGLGILWGRKKEIHEKLNIRPVNKKRLADRFSEPAMGDSTKEFIKRNKLEWNKYTRKYNAEGDVNITDDDLVDGRFPVEFDTVEGKFDCSHCKTLVSVEGSPARVWGDYVCECCDILATMKGAPRYVKGGFYCDANQSLERLECRDTTVYGDFACAKSSVKSLEDCPRTIKGSFDCGYTDIESLKGVPVNIGGHFNCEHCRQLKSLEHAPVYVFGYFSCEGCTNLVSLKGAPKHVSVSFNCEGCENVTEIGCEIEEIKGGFYYKGCTKLKSLKGLPRNVQKYKDA